LTADRTGFIIPLKKPGRHIFN